jgi:hypothetical protein
VSKIHAFLPLHGLCWRGKYVIKNRQQYPTGIAQDIPVKIRGYYVLVDFVVLNMELTKETPLILGRPFLSTAGAQIDVGAGEIRFNINGQEEKFEFRPRRQQECNMIRILYGPNPHGIRQVEI